jgi:hypothetical protein
MSGDNRKPSGWWWIAGVSILLFYALAGWPLGLITGTCAKYGWQGVSKGLGIIGYPHWLLAYHSRSYYAFLIHGFLIGLDMENATAGTWEQYREARDKR